MPSKRVGHVLRRAVPQTNPHDLGRSPAGDAQPMEVLVLRNEHAFVFVGELPNDRIRRSASPQLPDMKRPREQVVQEIDELLRKRLVE